MICRKIYSTRQQSHGAIIVKGIIKYNKLNLLEIKYNYMDYKMIHDFRDFLKDQEWNCNFTGRVQDRETEEGSVSRFTFP